MSVRTGISATTKGQAAPAGLFKRLPEPALDAAAIGWVEIAAFARPVLLEPVLGFGEEARELRIPERGAHVEGEAEFPVESFEDLRRRRSVGRCPRSYSAEERLPDAVASIHSSLSHSSESSHPSRWEVPV